MNSLEDGRSCPVCKVNTGCLQPLFDASAMGFTCAACHNLSYGYCDKEMACLHCSDRYLVSSSERFLTCVICGPSKRYSPLCYGYTQDTMYPSSFVCCDEHAAEYERQARSKTHVVVFGPDNRISDKQDTLLTPMIRIFDGLYDVKSAPRASFAELIPHISPLYLCDACDTSRYIEGSTTVKELLEKTMGIQEVLLLAYNQKPSNPVAAERSWRSFSSKKVVKKRIDLTKRSKLPFHKVRDASDIPEEEQENLFGGKDGEKEEEEPITLDGKLTKHQRENIWRERARKLWDQVEYNPQTGLFIETPMTEAHGMTLPGMGLIQEGDSTTVKEGSTPCVAVCLVRVRKKNVTIGEDGEEEITWISTRCSENIFVGAKAIRQHTSVQNHREALKRQGANDGKHYVLECDTCPRAKGNGYMKGQASWPWTHQHVERSASGKGYATTTKQLEIKSPSEEQAKAFLPVLESSTKARVVPWLQTICGYQEMSFPAESVFPDHIMRLHCMLYEKTRAVVFAFTGKLPLGYTEDMQNKLVCHHKFNLSEREEDRDTLYQLMCVPCNDRESFIRFADIMEDLTMERRLEAALEQIIEFDPHKDVANEPQFQGVLMRGQPLEHNFRIPNPNATRPFVPRKKLTLLSSDDSKKTPRDKHLTYKELQEKHLKKMPKKKRRKKRHKNEPQKEEEEEEKALVNEEDALTIVNALAPPNNKYQFVRKKLVSKKRSLQKKKSHTEKTKRKKAKVKRSHSAKPKLQHAAQDKTRVILNKQRAALGKTITGLNKALIAMRESGYQIKIHNYVGAVVNKLVDCCSTALFKKPSEVDGLYDLLVEPTAENNTSLFYATHVEAILSDLKAPKRVCQFAKAVIDWATGRLIHRFGEQLFSEEPTPLEILKFLTAVLEYWKVAAHQFHHTFKVEEAFKDSRNEGKRLAGKIVTSDHPLRQQHENNTSFHHVVAKEDQEEEDEEDEEDTYSSENEEEQRYLLWQSLQTSSQQEECIHPDVVDGGQKKRIHIENPDLWKPEENLAAQNIPHDQDVLWQRVLRKSQEKMLLQQQEEEYHQQHLQKLREREQKIREREKHLKKVRKAQDAARRLEQSRKRQQLSAEREEQRKKARAAREAEERMIFLNSGDHVAEEEIAFDPETAPVLDVSLLNLLRDD